MEDVIKYCPHCKKEITYLSADIKAMANINIAHRDLSPENSTEYHLSYFFRDTAKHECPECNEKITKKQFLKLTMNINEET